MTAPTTPVRSYDEALLDVVAPQSREFARTYARMLLRDRPEIDRGGVPLGPGQPTRPREPTWPEFSRTDQELNVALLLDALVLEREGEVLLYYRPHFTAARLYLGDPSLWRTRAVDGSSEARRDSMEIVSAWLAQGRALDAMLPAELHPLPPFDGETVAAPAAAAETPYWPGTPLDIRGI